jgi:hypothetical protein
MLQLSPSSNPGQSDHPSAKLSSFYRITNHSPANFIGQEEAT